MSSTYTTNVKFNKPAANDTGWDTPVRSNCDLADALATVSALAVTTHEQPSSTLLVDVAAGQFVDQSGTVQTYAGVSGQAITLSTTKVIYLDGAASWALTVAASYPTTIHVRLATVVAGATTITSITDNRQCLSHAGQRIPVVTHLLSTSASSPTIAAGAAAGSGPTVAASGTDLAGTVSVTTGTAPTTGILATVTFNVAFASAPRAIHLTPANSVSAGVAADVFANVSNITTAHFTVDAATALTLSTAYQWYYLIVG